jgi:glycerophosphoryl diester phosphodiesterase
VPLKRIGHSGASALAPGNTVASFEAALRVGIDMIEFDVRRFRGRLVLAHTALDARRRGVVSLAEALAHLGDARYDAVELNVDVKHAGCEHELLAALDCAGLLERTLLSSQVPDVLRRIRLADRRARCGISIGGRLARAWGRRGEWRAAALEGLARGRWEALMAQHRLVDGALLEQVSERGGQLYAWTVNERRRIESLRSLGVHGIATADPRLFDAVVPAG